MAPLDRQMVFWLALLAFGIIGFILSFLGEFVFHWFDDLGQWAAWITLGISIIAALGAAGRFQLHTVGSDVKDIKRYVAGIPRIEANTEAIPRIEANTEAIPRIEANTQRTEAHTAEAVTLLREIRDRLPQP